MNSYTVHHSVRWDEIPFDNQLMICRSVYEQMRVDRYRARELRFGFFGFIALADRQELWQGVQDWLNRETHPITHYQEEQQQIAQEQILRRLETRLRAVFNSLFRNADDELNLTGHAWTQIVFRIQSVMPEMESANGYRHAEIWATIADGLHRVRLLFVRLPLEGPYTSVNIRYVCPQRFSTFDTHDFFQSRGGTLEEFRAPLHEGRALAARPLDDAVVFQDWCCDQVVQATRVMLRPVMLRPANCHVLITHDCCAYLSVATHAGGLRSLQSRLRGRWHACHGHVSRLLHSSSLATKKQRTKPRSICDSIRGARRMNP
jgi:hypothetical protein